MAAPIIINSEVYKQNILTNIDYIFRNSILINKLWEKYICQEICNFIEDGTDFIDIGANIGLITLGTKLLLQLTNKKINKYHCIECNSDTFLSLKFNTAHHNDVNLYNLALADQQKLCNISTYNYNNGCCLIDKSYTENTINTYTYSHMNNNFKHNPSIFCLAVSLDSINYIFNNRVSVIKIDIEGFEDLMLQGAKIFLAQHKPTIIIEIFQEKYIYILNLLNDINYILFKDIGNINYIFVYNST